ncbi:MAG: 50S ribosomal protein L18 [bacterium]
MKARRRRKKIFGTAERPRLAVFRSINHIHAQVIDDGTAKTIVAASTLKMKKGGDVAAAKVIGTKIAELAIKAGIKKIVFDRGTAQYHGRIKALAEAAREGGLEF